MTDHQHLGPLVLPLSPPSADAARAVREKLRGHSTAPNWLPEGLWPEMDELRSEQLRVRNQIAAELAALDAVNARFRDEDRQHERQLRQAQRDGTPKAVEDRRTPPEQRQAERAEINERLWAGVIVLGEIVAAVIELVRESEDDWLADLRGQLEPAREKRREAERLLAEAKADEWQLHRLGQWVQITSEDGALGRQPAPTPSEPPAQFSAELLRSSLEVPWHRDRPWKGESEEPPRSWQEQSEDAAAPLRRRPRRVATPPARCRSSKTSTAMRIRHERSRPRPALGRRRRRGDRRRLRPAALWCRAARGPVGPVHRSRPRCRPASPTRTRSSRRTCGGTSPAPASNAQIGLGAKSARRCILVYRWLRCWFPPNAAATRERIEALRTPASRLYEEEPHVK